MKNIPDLVAVLLETKEKLQLKPGEWLVGYGYDGTTLEEGRDATRADLDSHFPDNPVVVMHVSLHGALLNTAGVQSCRASTCTRPRPKAV